MRYREEFHIPFSFMAGLAYGLAGTFTRGPGPITTPATKKKWDAFPVLIQKNVPFCVVFNQLD